MGVVFFQKLFSCSDGYGIQTKTGCVKQNFASKDLSVILKT